VLAELRLDVGGKGVSDAVFHRGIPYPIQLLLGVSSNCALTERCDRIDPQGWGQADPHVLTTAL
jgi:hypothetical protein